MIIVKNNKSKTLHLWAKSLLIISFFLSLLASADGENLYSSIQVDLPAQIMPQVMVTNEIPKGLTYDPDSLMIEGAAAYSVQSFRGSLDGTSPAIVTWNFKNVDNSADQDILIRFKTIVADIESNRNGISLIPASATLSWKDQEGTVHTSSDKFQSLKVIEPDLALERSFSPASGWSGDEIACTLRISHTASSTAPAYDVALRETLPAGLEYIPGSAEIVSGPAGSGLSGSDGPAWSFSEIDGSWKGGQKVALSYRARIADDVQFAGNLTCRADLAWTSTAGDNPQERSYTRSSQGSVQLDPPAPQLQISLKDSPDPLAPGGRLNYTISYENVGGPAAETKVEVAWDPSLAFLSATPAPDQGSENSWSLGSLPGNSSGSIQVSLKAPADAAEGLILTASALISSPGSPAAQASATTTIEASPSRLFVEKVADRDVVSPGGTINYTISYGNNGESPASNLSITDIVDSPLLFQEDSCTPAPSQVWSDEEGTHLFWNSTALSAGTLEPGE